MSSSHIQHPTQVRCPTCGKTAWRQYVDVSHFSDALAKRCRQDKWMLRTSCSACDYLMSFCPQSGAVIEACTF